MKTASADLLCIAPHPDDAEIGLGATLRLLADRGRRVWACDLTRGELGSNGTPAERWAEAQEAAARLGLAGRLQLELPDGFINAHDPAQIAATTAVIRLVRPRWIVTAPAPVRHPDHLATPLLVKKAAFMARLTRVSPPRPAGRAWPAAWPEGDPARPWRCEAIFEVCPPGRTPSLLFEVTSAWTAKMEALACYRSQFEAAEGRRPTLINDAAFLAQVERVARHWGFRAGVELAEALRGDAAPLLGDLPPDRWT